MPARGSDSGESLLEVVMAVAILGIAFVAILGGMVTTVLGTDIHHKQSQATTVLLAVSEAVKDPDATAYVACAVPADYASAAAAVAVPTGWSPATVASIDYWDGTTFQSTCYDTAAYGRLLRLQRVTVVVRSPDDRSVETLTFAKRDAA